MTKKRILLIVLLIAMLGVTAQANDEFSLRIGLSHSSGPVTAANALTDDGYRLGYYGDDFFFFEVARIDNHYVTFARDSLVYISGNSVSSSDNGGTAIKPYHLEVDATYATQEEAAQKLAEIRSAGFEQQGFVAFDGTSYKVRLDMYSTENYAAEDAGRVEGYTGGLPVYVVGGYGDTITVVDLNTYDIVFEYAVPYAWPAAEAMTGGQTIKRGQFYYRGGFEFQRHDGGDITLVNAVSMEDYIKGVLPYEMSPSWPLEALKAQAVTARTYALASLGKHASSGYDLCNTDNCQVYYGTERENENIVRASEETAGEVIYYGDRPVATYYFSASGGYTESAYNAWGGSTAPHAQAVPDPFESGQPITTYSTTLTLDDLTSIANSIGANVGSVTDFYVSEYTEPARNVYAVTFEGTEGTYTVSRTDKVRIALNMLVRSARFDIYPTTNLLVNGGEEMSVEPASSYVITGDGVTSAVGVGVTDMVLLTDNGTFGVPTGGSTYTVAGAGLGHNVGMSQYGAKGMAEAGFNYKDIVMHYYTGIDLYKLIGTDGTIEYIEYTPRPVIAGEAPSDQPIEPEVPVEPQPEPEPEPEPTEPTDGDAAYGDQDYDYTKPPPGT